MNVSEQFLPEYFDFFDSHLKLIVLDFYSQNNIYKEHIQKLRTEILANTYLFNRQEEISKNDLKEMNRIKENKEKVQLSEDEIKQKIIGYLNLIENAKNNNNYDTSSSINKKIVKFFLFRWMKLRLIKY
jgi:hypothetical protein